MTVHKTLFDYCPSNSELEFEVEKIVLTLDIFTADSLHILDNRCRELHRNTRVYCPILKNLCNRGLIEPLGFVNSKHESCHYRPIRQWRVKR